MQIREIMELGPVVPVIVLHKLEHALPLARALVAGGIRTLEITLRTPVALDCIRAIRAEVPDAVVGVGTITTPQDLERSIAAGAQFGVSPGATPELLAAVRDSGLPFLPGSMTPSEVILRRDMGFNCLKLFPAQQAGGVGMLKAMGAVFPDIKFCPTGGVELAAVPQFLALPNVPCVGGSWLAPTDVVAAEQWDTITALASAASALKKPAKAS